MQIIVQCPRCGCRAVVVAEAADRRLRCGKCRTLLRVPDLTEVPTAARIITHAAGELYVDEAGRTYG
jgi:uncharacterized Zn finger protein